MKRAYRLRYRPWRGAPEALCDIAVYRYPHGTVVVMTEPPDNRGMSVTNAVETIAALVANAEEMADPASVLWLEHYPDRHPKGRRGDPLFEEIYDMVELRWNRNSRGWVPTGVEGAGMFGASPVWKRISREVAAALIAGTAWIDPADPEGTVQRPVYASPDTMESVVTGGGEK